MAVATKIAAVENDELDERLAQSGLRVTPQRRHVHAVLHGKMDHPTADQVFLRTKEGMPEISMATVYNCLDALVKCGVVKQVNMDKGATRYCCNMGPHSHFYCDACGSVYDILQTIDMEVADFKMPRGFKMQSIETNIHGRCPECSAKAKKERALKHG